MYNYIWEGMYDSCEDVCYGIYMKDRGQVAVVIFCLQPLSQFWVSNSEHQAYISSIDWHI